MKRFAVAVCILVLTACGGDEITAPTHTPGPPDGVLIADPTPLPGVVTPLPTPEQPATRWYVGVINDDLSASLTNNTDRTQPGVLCAYQLPEQALVAGFSTPAQQIPSGQTGYFQGGIRQPRCGTSVDYQIDLGALAACPANGGWSRDVLAKFKFVRVHGPKCGDPLPEPTPTPQPSPTPSPEPTPTPQPTPTPTPQPTPTPTPQPTPTPTPQPTPTPTPTCSLVGPFGPVAFDLPNSGVATEQGWVIANVPDGPALIGPAQVPQQSPTWTAPANYPLVLFKGPQHHYVALGPIVAGQTYGPFFFNQNQQPQNLSHVSLFICGGLR